MTAKSTRTQRSPAAKLNVAGLVVAATGIMIQYVSGVDYPTLPPGPIILVLAAAVVAFGPWRWSHLVGLVMADWRSRCRRASSRRCGAPARACPASPAE